MTERPYPSVKKLFVKEAPELLKLLNSQDEFWSGIRNNTFRDSELDAIDAVLEEIGVDARESAVSRAIHLVQEARRDRLPTPFNLKV